MNIMQKTAKVVQLTADEGMWLTCYNDEQDILAYTGSKKVSCTNARASAFREITDAQHQAYQERYEIALAAANEASGEE